MPKAMISPARRTRLMPRRRSASLRCARLYRGEVVVALGALHHDPGGGVDEAAGPALGAASTDWRAFRRRRWGGLLWSGGLYSLDGAHAFLEHTIVRKGYRPDITLRELHQKTLRTLKVCAWDEALDPPQTVVLDDLTAGDKELLARLLAPHASLSGIIDSLTRNSP